MNLLLFLSQFSRSSLAPQTGPDALYSGLLECPVTTRITKKAHRTVRGSAVRVEEFQVTDVEDAWAIHAIDPLVNHSDNSEAPQ